jgi:hypothetical protein
LQAQIFLDLMGTMSHSTGPHPRKSSGSPAQRKRILTNSSTYLDRQILDRENPLDAPLVLLRAADGPLTDLLGVVISYLDELPPEFTSLYDDLFEVEELDALRRIHRGLMKLRHNAMPSREELEAISVPRETFSEIGKGVETATHDMTIPLRQIKFIDSNVVYALRELERDFLPGAEIGLVRMWFISLTMRPGALVREAEAPHHGDDGPGLP